MLIKNQTLYMTIKSAIQLAAESGTRLGLFKTAVRQLNENYEINEAVFGIVNGRPAEIEDGYFEIDREYGSVDEALDCIYKESQGIYVVSPIQAFTGEIRDTLSECKSLDNVLDIYTLEMYGR